MAQVDYPYCIYCDSQITWVIFDDTNNIVTFRCHCGEAVEVEIELENGERLLRDPQCSEGC